MPFWLHTTIGYIIAVLFANLVGIIIFKLHFSNINDGLSNLLSVYLICTVVTFITAFPGFLISIYIAKIKNMNSYYYWVSLGVLNVLAAHVLLALYEGGFFSFDIILLSLLSGAAGGYSYACFRKRFSYR